MTKIRMDMVHAVKDGDRVVASVLQALLARISSAEAVAPDLRNGGVGVGSTDVPRRQLSSSDIHQIVADEIQEIEEAANQLDPASDYAKELQRKASILGRYIN